MAASTQCPDREKLRAFVHRKVSDSDARRLHAHTGQCQHCQSMLRTINADNVSTMPIDATPLRMSEEYPFLQPAEQEDEIGRLGNYRILSLLGEGGMGYVFLAEDLTLGRPAALKVMKPEKNDSKERSLRFIKEAKALAQMKHEHLVPVYHADKSGDTVFYAMELLEGETLRDRLDREGILELDEILRLGKELASGLAFIHQQDLIHRDIKPANIWLEAPNDRVKILDLGLVRNVNEEVGLTRSGIVVGSLGFMSPEQARGTAMDARTDLFSLGCVLYRLCTGVQAFDGTSTMAVLTALATETPQPAGELNPDLPPALSKLVMKLLAKDPKDRPESADEVRERLERIGARGKTSVGPRITEGIQATPPTRYKKKSKNTKRMEKRRTKIVLGVAGGVIAICFGIVVAIALSRQRPQVIVQPKDGIPPAGAKFIDDFRPFVAQENWPFLKLPPTPDGKRPGDIISKGGVIYQHGIFMHPAPEGPTSISCRLAKKFSTFQTEVSLNDTAGQGPQKDDFKEKKKDFFKKKGPEKGGAASACVFVVYGDGKELWRSGKVQSQADTQPCNISVKGVEILKLEVNALDDPRGLHAVWLDPFVR
jgi:eukaryotic-like serine/threonine-protein kinase